MSLFRRNKPMEIEAPTPHEVWQHQRDELAEVLTAAQSGVGAGLKSSIVLKKGEHLLLHVEDTTLIEDRVKGGHWEGRSSGFSIPIGGGIRYRTGGTRGHYIAGTPEPTAIDDGDFYVTNQRAIFVGTRQTRECLFSKLITTETGDDGVTVLTVSNRQKATAILTSEDLITIVEGMLQLGIAEYNGTVDEFVTNLKSGIAQMDAAEPRPNPA